MEALKDDGLTLWIQEYVKSNVVQCFLQGDDLKGHVIIEVILKAKAHISHPQKRKIVAYVWGNVPAQRVHIQPYYGAPDERKVAFFLHIEGSSDPEAVQQILTLFKQAFSK
jgi:hypothetical protein